jgi:microsomal dipeptidase-like Zn-dependent dipeptidase
VSRGRRRLLWAGGVLAVPAAAAWLAGPGLLEGRLNRVRGRAPAPSARAAALHQRLFVADLHADTLLWGRDLLERSTRGQVDLPRLREGNVALQAFTVVTKTPRGMNVDRTEDAADMITALALLQRWPPATWTSLLRRAVYHARRFDRFCARSRGGLVPVRRGADVAELRRRRQAGETVVGGLLGLEGAQALEGDVANVEVLHAAGYRMIALTHFFDTEWAGSAHGVAKGGLTPAGRALVGALERRGILLDVAHASPAAIDDALAVATRPVVVSHTGVRGTCDNPRNLSDGHLRGVARTGGVVGIGFWSVAVCGTDTGSIARAVRHAVRVAGPEHVALGSDFDGAVTTSLDAAGLAGLTDALLRAGLDEQTVGRVMGGNVARLLERSLP